MTYRRFLIDSNSNSAQSITFQQVCLNAIQRFNSFALQSRFTSSFDRWNILEATFQDEMYCCLNYELRNLLILFEYSHTKDDKVDFYVFDKKWCIEMFQCESKTRIVEHATRFATRENYRTWNICEDYIILNFCFKSTLNEIDLEDNVFSSIRYNFVLTRTFSLDDEIQSHTLQIVLNSTKYTMKIYTHDNRLLTTLILKKERQKFYSNNYDSFFDNIHIFSAMQNQIVRMKKKKKTWSNEWSKRRKTWSNE